MSYIKNLILACSPLLFSLPALGEGGVSSDWGIAVGKVVLECRSVGGVAANGGQVYAAQIRAFARGNSTVQHLILLNDAYPESVTAGALTTSFDGQGESFASDLEYSDGGKLEIKKAADGSWQGLVRFRSHVVPVLDCRTPSEMKGEPTKRKFPSHFYVSLFTHLEEGEAIDYYEVLATLKTLGVKRYFEVDDPRSSIDKKPVFYAHLFVDVEESEVERFCGRVESYDWPQGWTFDVTCDNQRQFKVTPSYYH